MEERSPATRSSAQAAGRGGHTPAAPYIHEAPPLPGGSSPLYGEILGAWLEQERLRVKRSTWATYSGSVQRYIRPELGQQPVDTISAKRIGEFLDTLDSLAPATVRLICHSLRASLDFARESGCRVDAPTSLYLPHADRTEARTLSAADQRKLDASIRNNMTDCGLGILLALYTGIRLGEICALKWGDFDADCALFCIRRTVQRVSLPDAARARTGLLFDTPKSAASNRRIPTPASLLNELRAFRAPDDCFLLTSSPKRVMEPRRFQTHFKQELARAGVPDINFHSLRHTFATNCVTLGCDPTTLSRILGHSDVAITLNTYVHPSFDIMRGIMDRL